MGHRNRARARRFGRSSAIGVELLESRCLLSITIQFDYTYDNTGFFAPGSPARSVLEQAGQYLGSHLNDHLLAIPANPGTGNSWTASPFDPRNINASLSIPDLPVPADTIIVYAGASALPSGVVGFGGTGYSSFGSSAWNDLVAARGQAGALATPRTDDGTWGGAVTFDVNTSFGFANLGSPPVSGKTDFLAVALHELGHVVGLVPGSSDYGLVNPSNNTFLGKHSDAAYGGPVPLDPLDVHWASGTMSFGSPAIMDPEVAFNPQGAKYTSLDWGGLEDTGWETDSFQVSNSPSMATTGTGFPVAISVVDPDGLVDTAYTGTITLSLANNPSGAILGGVRSAPVVNGVATFSGLTLDQPGSNFTIMASGTDDTPPVVTNPFNVTLSSQATKLVLSTPPISSVAAGAPFGLTISAENVASQVDPNYNGPVTLMLQGSTGATLGGSLTVQAKSGVAMFSGLTLNKVGTGYVIKATSGTLPSISTSGIAVTPGPVASYGLAQSNGGQAIENVPFSVTVTAFDTFSNLVTNYAGTVHFSSTDPLATSTLPANYTFVPSDQGVHVFPSVVLKTLGAQTLTVTDQSNPLATGKTQVQVNPPATSKTTLIAIPSAPTYGQSVEFQATVTPGVVNGTVTFLDGTAILGTAQVVLGQATFSTSKLAGGSHSITATYGGSLDGTIGSSPSAALPIAVKVATTTATLTSSTGSTSPNRSVTLAVVMTPISTSLAFPSGTVKFFDGTVLLGTIPLNASGQASLVAPSFTLGTHSITATYSGDSNYATIKSAATSVYSGDGLKDDFDGDGKADLTYFGVIPGTKLYGFTILTSSSGFNPAKAIVWDNNGFGYGNSASIPVPADYFGDGKSAYAVWQPDGHGYMELYAISSANPAKGIAIDFGLTTDLPVVGDVDGDGKADFGVYGYYPGVGYRFDFLLSSRTSTAYPFGFDPNQRFIFDNYGHGAVYGSPTATPVVADFDGSGHAGLGVYLPTGTTSTFYYDNFAIPKGTGFVVDPPETFSMVRTFGYSTDVPMAVDYDGDGKADLAVYGLDPKTGRYRFEVLLSSTNFNTTNYVYFDNGGNGYGYSATIPTMADYEGTGLDDFGVYQPDGKGGATFYYQIRANNQGKVYDVVPSSADLPANGPTYLLARRVRGQ
jgi:Bacterial Ig-like domain (group 3)